MEKTKDQLKSQLNISYFIILFLVLISFLLVALNFKNSNIIKENQIYTSELVPDPPAPPELPQINSMDMNFSSGWNLVSFPRTNNQPIGQVMNQFINSNTGFLLYQFNKEADGSYNWSAYSNYFDMSGSGYTSITNISQTKTYWLWLEDAQTNFSLSYLTNTTDDFSSISLTSGWNTVSLPKDQIDDVVEFINPINNSTYGIYGYDNTWEYYSPYLNFQTSGFDTVNSPNGYFIYIFGDQTLYL